MHKDDGDDDSWKRLGARGLAEGETAKYTTKKDVGSLFVKSRAPNPPKVRGRFIWRLLFSLAREARMMREKEIFRGRLDTLEIREKLRSAAAAAE